VIGPDRSLKIVDFFALWADNVPDAGSRDRGIFILKLCRIHGV
jgi:hypothetical protein